MRLELDGNNWEVFRYYNIDGSVDRRCFEIESSNKKLVVLFLEATYRNDLRWTDNEVLTNLKVSRCQMSEIYRLADPSGENLMAFIIDGNHLTGRERLEEIKKAATKEDVITFDLAMQNFSKDNTEKLNNVKSPVIVKINGQSATRCFKDYGCFGPNVINKAYESLIKGKNPSEGKFSNYEVGYLHSQIVGFSPSDVFESDK